MNRNNKNLLSAHALIKSVIAGLHVSLILLPLVAQAGNPVVDRVSIVGLLETEKFDELEVKLNDFQKNYEKGKSADKIVAEAFISFSNSDPELEGKFARWIAIKPDSYAAHLARGIYYVNLGFLSRGGKFRSETPEDRFAGMREYFESAAVDLEKTLALNPRLTVGYRHLMRISMASGLKETTKALFDKALAVDLASYAAWNGYLFTLQPKWGGSMIDLGAAVREMEKQYARNPELKALAGYMPYTYGDAAEREDKNALALDYYSRAIDFGGSLFLMDRGTLHYRIKSYDAALQDFNRVLEVWPHHSDALMWRGKVREQRKEHELALQDYDLAVKLDKLEPDALRHRGELREKMNMLDLALQDYNDALIYGDNKASNWFNRGELYLSKFKDYKKAVDDLGKAVEIEPGYSHYWYRYGVAHYYLKDCGIMESLGTYVKLCEQQSCPESNLNWSRNSISHLETKGTCRN